MSPSELDDAMRIQSPLLLEFCAVLDRMQDCALLGAAVLCHFCLFFQNLVHRVIASCTGGPDLAGYECEQCPAASTTNECLISGVCVGV